MNRKVKIFVDGASRGNPGEASYGVVIRNGNKVITLAQHLGTMTNNEAEYWGLITALRWAVENGSENVTIYSDSLLVVNQMKGKYKVKARNLQPLFLKAVELENKIPDVKLHHVKREQNRAADRMANLALDGQWTTCRENSRDA